MTLARLPSCHPGSSSAAHTLKKAFATRRPRVIPTRPDDVHVESSIVRATKQTAQTLRKAVWRRKALMLSLLHFGIVIPVSFWSVVSDDKVVSGLGSQKYWDVVLGNMNEEGAVLVAL